MCSEVTTILEKSTFDDCSITLHKSNYRDKWSVETICFDDSPDTEPVIEYYDTLDKAQLEYDYQVECKYYGDEF